jgi:hypothetical protein
MNEKMINLISSENFLFQESFVFPVSNISQDGTENVLISEAARLVRNHLQQQLLHPNKPE